MFESLRTLFCRFTPVEERLLAEFTKLLPSGVAEKVQSQIAAFNRVQRLLDWTEVNFYHLRRGKPAWEEVERCADKSELNVAEIRFLVGDKSFRARFKFVEGHLFSLVIRPSIKPYAFAVITKIVEAKLLANPDRPNSSAPNKTLPQGFVQWVRGHKERDINGWDVLEEGAVYSISLEDAEYMVLAVRQGVEFLLAKDEPDSLIFRADADETQVRALGVSFGEALLA
jgi:hypothetical protein